VAFTTDARGLIEANLRLCTASRVLVRVASFRATAFHELERSVRRTDWKAFLTDGTDLALRASCHKSRLYHRGAVAERVRDAIARQVRIAARLVGEEEGVEDEPQETRLPSAMLLVRLDHDVCTLSMDSSGELLHRRGWRQAIGRAPLRETLGAAMVLAARWDGGVPLLDPMCGSGTLPIEAARLARGILPGAGRPFAFDAWSCLDRGLSPRLKASARRAGLARLEVEVRGSDRDPAALKACLGNAERAGVAADVAFVQADLARCPLPSGGPGLLLVNPPYGRRLADDAGRASLLARLLDTLSGRFGGWTLGILLPGRSSGELRGFDAREAFHTRNGGIPVRFMVGRLP
jgi:putative N6-adenine-specific DNA methylase